MKVRRAVIRKGRDEDEESRVVADVSVAMTTNAERHDLAKGVTSHQRVVVRDGTPEGASEPSADDREDP